MTTQDYNSICYLHSFPAEKKIYCPSFLSQFSETHFRSDCCWCIVTRQAWHLGGETEQKRSEVMWSCPGLPSLSPKMTSVRPSAFFLLLLFCCAPSESYAVEETSSHSEPQTRGDTRHLDSLSEGHSDTSFRRKQQRVGKCKSQSDDSFVLMQTVGWFEIINRWQILQMVTSYCLTSVSSGIVFSYKADKRGCFRPIFLIDSFEIPELKILHLSLYKEVDFYSYFTKIIIFESLFHWEHLLLEMALCCHLPWSQIPFQCSVCSP